MKHDKSTHIRNIVVLVVDRGHKRFGQIGKMLYHDWKELGIIGVEYADGEQEQFYDDKNSKKIICFYRKIDKRAGLYDGKYKGPSSFIKAISRIRPNDLEYFTEQYKQLFGEEMAV